MCIAVFMWKNHPLYQLVLLLNRDEYHSRPTKCVSWWDNNYVLGGRDEVAGGTWLACSRKGRLAFLTNVRETKSVSGPKSRGHLPLRFLKSEKSPVEFAKEILEEECYLGFNLVLTDICTKTMIYVTNRSTESCGSIVEVSEGFHVLSNAKLDTKWPKCERLLLNFEQQLHAYGDGEVCHKDMAEKLMTDRVKYKEGLPTVYSPHREYLLSSIFVEEYDNSEGIYGTRSISALTVGSAGDVCFFEKYVDDDGCWREHTHSFTIDTDPALIHPSIY